MEPVSSLGVGYGVGKLMDVVAAKVSRVIERWSRHRAENFFAAFCQEVLAELDGASSDRLDEMLDALLEDEMCSAVVFDAYRSVCLTKSKALGPRIIALLTAEIVTSHRPADEDEESIVSATEELSDRELIEFADFVIDHYHRAEEESDRSRCSVSENGTLSLQIGEESFDSTWHRETNVSLGPLDLASDLGSWALTIKRHGLLSDDVKERQWDYEVDSERHIDEPGIVRQVTWWLYLRAPCLRFAKLVKRAARTIDGTATGSPAPC